MAVEYPFLEVLESPTFGNCIVHSPFIVAIRSTTPTDSEVLEVLGLSRYRASSMRDRSSPRQVFITNTGEWTLVADDWYYTLWHADKVWDVAGDRDVTRACGRWGVCSRFGSATPTSPTASTCSRMVSIDDPCWSNLLPTPAERSAATKGCRYQERPRSCARRTQ